MNIIVCVKQVYDPEAPISSFKIDEAGERVLPPQGVNSVISIFDEYAVEAALLLKEKCGGKVTALTLGSSLEGNVVRKPLAMGCDDLVILDDPVFSNGDSFSTAYALSLAIKKIGEFDLILCGRQSADWDSGQVGPGIAEILGIPSVTVTKKLEFRDGKLITEKVLPDGVEMVEVALPALVTLSNEHSAPRYPIVTRILAANKRQIVPWKPGDIGADPSRIGLPGRRCRLVKLYEPVGGAECEMVEGDSPEEAADKLADKLREAKLI